MSSTFDIQLHGLRFTAAHGVYEEEARTGNEFEVNIRLSVKAPKKTVTALDDTINYGEVYQTVKTVFLQRKALLETIAMETAAALKTQFPLIQSLSIQIIKLHPPITSFTGSVSVTYNKAYKN